LHGTIRDAVGGVIPGARVSTFQESVEGGAEADATGAYELCVPVGNGSVVVSAAGYARVYEFVNVYGPVRRDFALVPEAIVAGKVVRASDRSAVAGAVVELRRDGYDRRAPAQFATSDANGAFQFDGVYPGNYGVTAIADGYATREPVSVVAEIGQQSPEIVCAVDESVSIAGRVVEANAPVAGAYVFVQAEQAAQTDFARQYEKNAYTQADGTFVIQHVFAGEYSARVGRYDLAKEPPKITVANADVTNVLLEVERRASISGRVTHAGKPVEGAAVSVRSGERNGGGAVSDHAGKFTITGVPPSTYQVYAQSNRVGAFTPGPTVTVAKGEQKTGLEIEMDLAGSVRGVVVDQNDKPVAGAFVRFSLLRGRDFGVATTADDGSFAALALSGGGDYAYDVRPSAESPAAYEPVGRKRFAPITVRDGSTHITGLRIQVKREQLAISGRVVDAAKKPVADALVNIEPMRGYLNSALTDANGAFTIGSLTPGAYMLRATQGARVGHANGAAGRNDIVIALEEPGAIEGTIEGFTKPAVSVVSEMGQRVRVEITGTTFRAGPLPAGGYRVSASDGKDTDVVDASVDAGTTAKVTLRRRGLGSIAGTVTDEAKRPVANVMCRSFQTSARYMGTGRQATDAAGAYRLDKLRAGEHEVVCGSEIERVTVVENQTARLDFVTKPTPKRVSTADIGLVLEDQLRDVRVKSVAPNSPAARAGFAVGDILVKVDDIEVEIGMGEHAIEYVLNAKKKAAIKIDRGETELVLQLAIE
jgi:protocatechuate 3,4-dioxygenase beta subunit